MLVYYFADIRFINDLHLLANIIPPKGRTVIRTDSGRKHWKFSILESIEGIIIHCKVRYFFDLKNIFITYVKNYFSHMFCKHFYFNIM